MENFWFQNDEFFYKIAFEWIDSNNDDFISEVDLFTTITALKNIEKDDTKLLYSRLKVVKDTKNAKMTENKAKPKESKSMDRYSESEFYPNPSQNDLASKALFSDLSKIIDFILEK